MFAAEKSGPANHVMPSHAIAAPIAINTSPTMRLAWRPSSLRSQGFIGSRVFGDCPSALSGLLAEEAMQDFYEQYCCFVGTTHLYIALFGDGRKEWVYVSDPGMTKPLLEGCK